MISNVECCSHQEIYADELTLNADELTLKLFTDVTRLLFSGHSNTGDWAAKWLVHLTVMMELGGSNLAVGATVNQLQKQVPGFLLGLEKGKMAGCDADHIILWCANSTRKVWPPTSYPPGASTAQIVIFTSFS